LSGCITLWSRLIEEPFSDTDPHCVRTAEVVVAGEAARAGRAKNTHKGAATAAAAAAYFANFVDT
jgi:hypothetical protein